MQCKSFGHRVQNLVFSENSLLIHSFPCSCSQQYMNYNQFTIALFPGLPTIQFLITSLQYANVDGGKAWGVDVQSQRHVMLSSDYSSLQGQVGVQHRASNETLPDTSHVICGVYSLHLRQLFINCWPRDPVLT